MSYVGRGLSHGWKCCDISSIFWVSSLLDMISANESQMKEKSKNIDDILAIYKT